jgi:hypothetical protein
MRRTTTLLPAVLLLAASLAQAEDATTAANFKSLDANGDGKVTMAENRQQADSAFKQVDRNGDGTVSRDEYGRAMGEPVSETAPARP